MYLLCTYWICTEERKWFLGINWAPEALDLVPLRMPGRSLSTVSSRKAELNGLWGLHGSHLWGRSPSPLALQRAICRQKSLNTDSETRKLSNLKKKNLLIGLTEQLKKCVRTWNVSLKWTQNYKDMHFRGTGLDRGLAALFHTWNFHNIRDSCLQIKAHMQKCQNQVDMA